MKRESDTMLVRALAVAMMALVLPLTATAQTNDEVLNQLLGTAPGAAPAPAAPVAPAAPATPAAPEEPGLYRHFSAIPPVDDLVEALLPTPMTRNLAEIPREQRRTAGLEIPFDLDSDRINARAQAFLDRLGPAMQDNRVSGYRFALVGHTDATGNAGYNSDLSRRRAQAVQQYLMQRWGIPPSRLEANWFGESRPRYAPATDGRNRRVEAQIAGRN